MPGKNCEHNKRKDSCFKCDPSSALGYIVRARINIVKKKYPALQITEKPEQIIGMTYGEYRRYLSARYEQEYGRQINWDDYHDWASIEHIIPVSDGANDKNTMMSILRHDNTCIMERKANIHRGNDNNDYETWLACNRLGAINVN